MKTKFRGKHYRVIITDHASLRMSSRGVSELTILEIIETGFVKMRDKPNKFWIYRGTVCVAIVVEDPNLILVTVMLNWRPI